ncbi:MAG: hypothetical protein HYV27_15900 [Candidatus Hydrogenedentes bacterium]|nr:hypothetical protein [Candidatus Hydrogenedentota bacterium]
MVRKVSRPLAWAAYAAAVLGATLLTGMDGCEPCAKYTAGVTPADFSSGLANPYYPLIPGTVYRYRKDTDEGIEEATITITDQVRVVAGVTCVVVRDTSTVNGELAEDTFDWFAQDNLGNVWYFGEDTKEYEDGAVASTAGSWEAGVNGAEPGIIMLAEPAVGNAYRQEFLCGEAEDEAEVIAIDSEASVGETTYTDCVKTRDFSRLDPDVVESKYYAPGIGFVLAEETDGGLELISVTNPL